MSDELHFWTVIGIDETTIPQLRQLENLLNKFQQESYDKNDLSTDAYALIGIFEKLCETSYPILKSIDIEQRQTLFDSISNKLQHITNELKQILDDSTWKKLANHIQAFRKLCSLDFNNKPLMFAKQALKYKNMPKKLEFELIKLIENMKEKYPNLLNDILSDEYKEIKTNHRDKIVISVLGSTKSCKSSLINFLLEFDVCPTGNQAATARLTKITYGEHMSLKLIDSGGVKQEEFVFNDPQKLLEKATEVIILQGKYRKSKLCEDEIIIELPINELKGIELWDIPGFDENPVINKRIAEILKDTDLVLAVLAQHDSLKLTAIDFIKPCLVQDEISRDKNKPVTKICFIISQIDKFKSDELSKETKETFLQHIYDKIREELPTKFQQFDYKLSNQFIAMCSSPKHSMRHYLECREEFIEKSCHWFKNALHDLTINRTNFLLNSIKEFSIYEDIYRQDIRYKRTKEIFNKDFLLFSQQLTEDVNKKFNEIRLIMKELTEKIVTKCRDIFYDYKSLEIIEQYIQAKLTIEFKEILTSKTPEIIRMISMMCIKFSNTIQLKPAEIQILKHALNDALNKDYYSNIIEQYQYSSPYHLSAYLTRIFHAFSETLQATIKIPFGDFEKMRRAFSKFTTRETYMEKETMESITKLVSEILENISDELQKETEKTLKNILNEQLNRIHEEIEKKTQKYIHSSTTDTKIDHLRQFYADNLIEIKRMHLDILDIQFNLDYSLTCKINRHQRLDENSNFPVYTGTLRTDKVPIAAKLIPLKDFKLQEVLYIRELKHKNVIKYYGVQKANENYYYIIMPRFDCNLATYLADNSTTFNPSDIDQMIIQIITGLDYIHTQLELIHRDIKLENILVNRIKKRFLIADLGGVHREPITCVYTEGYAPPELFARDNQAIITEKYDIYSLGIVIQKIIRLTNVEKFNDNFIVGWLILAERCCSQEPSARPTCQKLLSKRTRRVVK